MPAKRTYAELEQRVIDLEREVAGLNRSQRDSLQVESGLRSLIQGSPIPTFVIDTHHVITLCNRAYERLRGLATDEIVGTHGNWLDRTSSERPFMADYIVDRAPEEEMAWYYGGRCRKSKVVDDAWEAEVFLP
jgi:PAS domain S-box-containing protein